MYTRIQNPGTIPLLEQANCATYLHRRKLVQNIIIGDLESIQTGNGLAMSFLF